MIQAEPRTKDVDVRVVTHAGATTGEDGTWEQVQFIGKKKVAFDIVMEKHTFFEAKHAIERNPGKLPIIKMLSAFDPSVEVGSSQQHGTLQQFFESFLSLERDPKALVDIEKLLYHRDKTLKDSAVNYLQKRKTRKEMRMKIQIKDYEVDSAILDLRLDVNILTKKTW